MSRNNAEQPTLQMWRFFVLAVDHGSLLRVADITGSDIAFISRELTRLEVLMKEPLLERSKRGVKPTWAGVLRYRQAREVVADFDKLLATSDRQMVSNKTIRIAVPASLASLFVQWVALFGALPEGRECSVEIEQYADNTPLDIMGFDYFVCEDVLPNVRVIASLLGYIRRGIVASPDFLKSQTPVNVPEDLETRQLIAERSGRYLMLGNGQSIAIQVDPVVRVNSASALAAPALASAGYAVGVSFWQIHDNLVRGELVQVLPQWLIAPRPVWLLRLPKREYDAQSQKLIRFFSDQWLETPGLDTPNQSLLHPLQAEIH